MEKLSQNSSGNQSGYSMEKCRKWYILEYESHSDQTNCLFAGVMLFFLFLFIYRANQNRFVYLFRKKVGRKPSSSRKSHTIMMVYAKVTYAISQPTFRTTAEFNGETVMIFVTVCRAKKRRAKPCSFFEIKTTNFDTGPWPSTTRFPEAWNPEIGD